MFRSCARLHQRTEHTPLMLMLRAGDVDPVAYGSYLVSQRLIHRTIERCRLGFDARIERSATYDASVRMFGAEHIEPVPAAVQFAEWIERGDEMLQRVCAFVLYRGNLVGRSTALGTVDNMVSGRCASSGLHEAFFEAVCAVGTGQLPRAFDHAKQAFTACIEVMEQSAVRGLIDDQTQVGLAA